jgi:hypothetical protein
MKPREIKFFFGSTWKRPKCLNSLHHLQNEKKIIENNVHDIEKNGDTNRRMTQKIHFLCILVPMEQQGSFK